MAALKQSQTRHRQKLVQLRGAVVGAVADDCLGIIRFSYLITYFISISKL